MAQLGWLRKFWRLLEKIETVKSVHRVCALYTKYGRLPSWVFNINHCHPLTSNPSNLEAYQNQSLNSYKTNIWVQQCKPLLLKDSGIGPYANEMRWKVSYVRTHFE